MSIFKEFDDQIDLRIIDEQKREAAMNGDYEKAPAGEYIAKIEKMELGLTKDKRPMFKVQMRLVQGLDEVTTAFVDKFKKKKPCVFMNRVIFNTKNDGAMIRSVELWLSSIFPDDDPVTFQSYSAFEEEIANIAEDVGDALLCINYNPDSFNSIVIVND